LRPDLDKLAGATGRWGLPFNTPKGRAEAERVITFSLQQLTELGATPAQLSDLADALDALRARSYNMAVELGLASLRNRGSSEAMRPPRLARSLTDLQTELLTLIPPSNNTHT